MRYLIEPTPDLRDSWLAAQREHAEIDGGTENWGLSISDLETGEDTIDRLIQSRRVTPGTYPGLTNEWWWVEATGDGEPEYIGRVVLQPEPGPQEGHLRVAVRPSRRRQGHGGQLLRAALQIAASRGLPSVILACPKDDRVAHQFAHRAGATLIARGGVDRYNLPTMSTVE